MSIFKTPTPPYRTKSGPVISHAPADRDVCDWVRGLARTATPTYQTRQTRTDPEPDPGPGEQQSAQRQGKPKRSA